ncbi:serine/arginine-rich splicing factor SC35-like [Rosa sericea]
MENIMNKLRTKPQNQRRFLQRYPPRRRHHSRLLHRYAYALFRGVLKRAEPSSPPPTLRSLFDLVYECGTTADDLFLLFDKYGKVVDVFIPRDRRTGDSRGFAFVRYKYQDEAAKAVDKLDGRVVDGREIMVQFSKYGPNAERIHKGKISESSSKLKSRSRSRSPRPRYRDEYKDRDYKRRSRSRSRDIYDRDRHHRSERKHRYRSRSRNNRKRSKYDDELRSRSQSYGRYRILPLPKVVGAGPIAGVSQEREVQCEARRKCGCYGGFDLPIERWSCCPNSAHSCACRYCCEAETRDAVA